MLYQYFYIQSFQAYSRCHTIDDTCYDILSYDESACCSCYWTYYFSIGFPFSYLFVLLRLGRLRYIILEIFWQHFVVGMCCIESGECEIGGSGSSVIGGLLAKVFISQILSSWNSFYCLVSEYYVMGFMLKVL